MNKAYRHTLSTEDQQGFTLIELIIVIVILATLSVVALPKFTNLSSDARVATLTSLEGSLTSSLKNLRIVCELYQECRDLPSWPNLYVYLPAYGQDIMLIGGYPEAGTLSRSGEIHDLINTDDFVLSNPDSTRTRWAIDNTENCYVEYKQIASGETFPVITLEQSGC